MKTIEEVSHALSAQTERVGYGKTRLAHDAGITFRTLSHVLQGNQDFKVSTLLAVADRLGLELMLVPREARSLFGAAGPAQPAIPSVVDAALQRLKSNRSQ
ncbi:helix-turn-helix domain-containing protein [Cupriavidus gilardii]|jgi:DNA-binding phage protein|uniref:helix-turn-helix domain-containing protein n=1 Tax=Cupriavidus gilardii TaxID=82541 RepID=UPI001580C4CC|nr:helix-turn-helix transcriptional regulator [Cupriavidus gilardii]MCT9070489.1 helix-turn-helix domain-containing protein [Cupriavidus gilardii]QKS61135.1 helix-turn-helix transcriptional regulator [Cupriavidus gilardii]